MIIASPFPNQKDNSEFQIQLFCYLLKISDAWLTLLSSCRFARILVGVAVTAAVEENSVALGAWQGPSFNAYW